MRKAHYISILFILLTGLIFLFWFDFKHNLIAIGWDIIIPLNPVSNLKYLYTWTDLNNGIVILSSLHFIFLLYAFLQKLGLSLTSSQFIHTYLIHTIGALGMYYLAVTAFKDHPRKKIIAILSSILYMFSPAMFNMYFAYSSFAFIPLILGLFTDGLSKKNGIFYAMAIGIVFAAGNLPDPNPRPFLITLAPLILFAFFTMVISGKVKKILIFLLTVFIYIFLINCWYFLGFLLTALQNNNLMATAENIIYTYGGKLPDQDYSTIDRMFRLFNDGLNMPTPLLKTYLSNWLINLTNYLLPLLVFSSLFFIKNKSKNIVGKIVFFLLLGLLFIFLSKSSNAPFGNLYRLVLERIPVLRAFRTTAYLILCTAVSYSILAAYTIVEIKENLKKNPFLSLLIPVSLVILLLVNSYPLLMGYPTLYEFYSNKNLQRGRKIPESYYAFEKYLKSDESDVKILSLPLTFGYEALKSDPNYYGIPLLPLIISKPLIGTRNFDFGNSNAALTEILEAEIITANSVAKNIAGMTNVKYLLLKRDASGIDPEYSENVISMNFKKLLKSDELVLFQNSNEFLLPHFYIPRETFISDSPPIEIPEILNSLETSIIRSENRIAIYFSKQNKGFTRNFPLTAKWNKKDTSPQLEFKKINPTKYRVRIHNALNPFPLVFLESFHPGWGIYLSDIKAGNKLILADLFSEKIKGSVQNDNLPDGNFFEPWFYKKLAQTDHLLVNSFANSWTIKPDKICTSSSSCIKNADNSYDFELLIFFEPQKLADLGYFVSLITILITILFLIIRQIFTINFNRKT